MKKPKEGQQAVELPQVRHEAWKGYDDDFDDGEGDIFLCRECGAELPNERRGRCPFCGERP